MIAGDAGGRIRTGFHLAGKADPITRVGLTVLQAMGVQVDHWGALSICRSSAAVAAKLSSAGYPAGDIHQNGSHSERRRAAIVAYRSVRSKQYLAALRRQQVRSTQARANESSERMNSPDLSRGSSKSSGRAIILALSG
ncbi:MAG: hypothetical protein JWO04_2206 [Gammaproteobacteria bacterium]|nr:hypothetical protein [Gammaproteobacteria bacterium]